jgi:hypothetical protein
MNNQDDFYGYAATCHKHSNRKDALFDLHVDVFFQWRGWKMPSARFFVTSFQEKSCPFMAM